MKISIVVPVYNAEKYLEECIESVLNQTNSNWELVLVDDGSTDKSAEICDAYAEQYPEKIATFHKLNGGEFLARKYGIQKCTGEYIGFLDADDLLDKEYVEILNRYFIENSADVICFNFARFSESMFKEYLSIRNTVFESEEKKNLYEKIASGELSGMMWSKVFKSDLLNRTYIDETTVSKMKFGPDAFHSFSIIFSAEKVQFIDDALYYYRDNPLSASAGYEKRELGYFNIKYVFELIEEFLLKSYSADEDLFKKLYAHNFNATVNHMLKFYRNAKSLKRKKQLVEYNWQTYLLDATQNYIENNEYVRESYIKVWKAFSKKAYIEIYIREKFKRYIGW